MDAPPVRYLESSDGFKIAYAVTGRGPALVLMPWPASHIRNHWVQNSYVQPWLTGLAARFRLVQYDSRGQGMSSRGLPDDFAMSGYGRDLEAVVDELNLADFALMSVNGIGHEAVRYAVRNPQRVRALIMASPVVEGRVWPQALWGDFAERDWDGFIMNTALLARGPNPQEVIARIKQATTRDDWLKWIRALQNSSIESELPMLRTPTLIIHPRDYDTKPEEAIRVASAATNGRIVTIDGASLLGDAEQGLQAIDSFLSTLDRSDAAAGEVPVDQLEGALVSSDSSGHPVALSVRQSEVLRLIAQGRRTKEIAETLSLSARTIERHIADLYARIGVRNRAEAARYAFRYGISESHQEASSD